MKIEKLTKEQEFQLKVYKNKGLEIGLSTERFDLETAKPIIDNVYSKILKKKTVPIFILDNPLQAWYAVCMLANIKNNQVERQVRAQVRAQVGAQVEDQVRAQVGAQVVAQVVDQVRDQVWDQVRDQVERQVWDQVWDQVGDQVRDQVRDQVWDQVRDQVGDQVRAQVWDQVRDQVGDQVPNFVYPYLDGSFSQYIFSFYDFFKDILNVKGYTNLYEIWKSTQTLGLIYPLDNFCVVSQKPSEINMVDGKLHKDGDMALKYSDGWGFYALNGTRVPEYLAVTPESELDIEFFKKDSNADIKAEFIRKFGMDRMESMGKKIDSYENYNYEMWTASKYELIDMSPVFKSISYAPHLKMTNQTTGVFHLEGVSPECKTLEQALNFRMSGKHKQITAIK